MPSKEIWRVFALLAFSCCASAAETAHPSIGLNKFDLFKQYLGTASGGDGSVAYRKVTRAMAIKAIEDAEDIGTPFFRVSAAGFFDRDLALWQSKPAAYWSLFDQMMADLDAHHIKIVPVLMQNAFQIPKMNGETVAQLVRDPHSQSWQMLSRYVTEFVTRYRTHPALLFYDLTNELNLKADLDAEHKCEEEEKQDCQAVGNFSTDDMIQFMARYAKLIRAIDSQHPLSSGFSIPRPSAQHLRVHPVWKKSKGAWTKDSEAELAQYLADVHRDVDIISVHVYPTKENQRLGIGAGQVPKLLAIIKAAADRSGKPLFVGEFGEPTGSDNPGSFGVRALDEIVRLRIPYSALWAWEFYQNGLTETRSTKADRFSLEPGYSDMTIARFKQANAALGRAPKSMSAAGDRPPRVVLTSPLPCKPSKGSPQMFAVASDDSGKVKGVEFSIDGKTTIMVSSPPYRVDAPVSGWSTVAAKACDYAGNCAVYEVRASDASCSEER